jgi:hypothetical protein
MDAQTPKSQAENSPLLSEKPLISKTTFFAGSLGAFSLGILYGVRRSMKAESNLVSNRNSKISGALLGFKALGLGTALCLGTFLGIGAIYAKISGITTIHEFAIASKQFIRKVGIEYVPTDEEKQELEKAEKELEKYIRETFGKGGGSEKENEKR